MIVDERYVTYMNSLDQGNLEYLEELEQEAVKNNVPIIRKEMQSLLKVLIQMKDPDAVLEIGTAVGFSALLMSECVSEACHITTIEKYQKRIPLARENFRAAGKEKQITLLEGDALDIVRGLTERYDFIFLDAAKGQYVFLLPELVRLLRPGGILVTDNVFQDGEIIEPRYGVERRNRTIHSRMRDYLYQVKNHEQLESAILPLGDGVSISTKKRKEPLQHE